MSTSQFGIFLSIVFVIAIVLRIRGLKKSKVADKSEDENLEDPMQNLFFEKVSAGAEKVHFLNLSGTNGFQDIIVLKNLMQSENIPYYSEFENFNTMNAGIGANIKLYVLKENYDQALAIVEKYNKTTKLSSIMVIKSGV
jgi:hypothetical protein